MRKRNNTVYVRFSDEEYSNLKSKLESSGQTLQSYIITSALGAKVTSKEEADAMKEKNKSLADMDRQLRGMATNLNQLAMIANSTHQPATAEILSLFLNEVRDFRKEVNDQWQSTRQSISRQKHTEP